MKKTYLGDGLYAESDGYQIRLYTDSMFEDDQVFLDPEVLTAFKNFIAELERVESKGPK